MYKPNPLRSDPKKSAEKRIKASVKKVNDAYSLPKLQAKLWEVFSAFIRARDSKDSLFKCISCNQTKSTRDGNLQAGHYFKSEMYSGIRYNEWNVNGQCKSCNLYKEGNRQGYQKGLLRKIGKDKLDMLDNMKNNKSKWGRFEYQILIEEYKLKLKNL